VLTALVPFWSAMFCYLSLAVVARRTVKALPLREPKNGTCLPRWRELTKQYDRVNAERRRLPRNFRRSIRRKQPCL